MEDLMPCCLCDCLISNTLRRFLLTYYVIINFVINYFPQTDEVSILSYNDDSNSSNVVEVNIPNGNASHAQEHKQTDKSLSKPEHTPSTSSTIACT